MRLIYHPDAEAELVEAIQFYGRVDLELGTRFLDRINRAIQVIFEAPNRWKIVEADVRRYVIHRFPFAIYYRVLPDHLRIIAVTHHSRNPAYWRSRIAD